MFILTSLKTLTYSKDCSESRIKLFWPSFSICGPFSPVYIYGLLAEKNSGHRRLSGQLFQSQSAFGKLEKAFYRELLEGFSQLLHRPSRNFIMDFFHKKHKKCEIEKHSYKKYCFSLKRYPSRDTSPLNLILGDGENPVSSPYLWKRSFLLPVVLPHPVAGVVHPVPVHFLLLCIFHPCHPGNQMLKFSVSEHFKFSGVWGKTSQFTTWFANLYPI